MVDSLVKFLDSSFGIPTQVTKGAIRDLTDLVKHTTYPYPFVREVNVIDPSEVSGQLPLHHPDVAILCHYIHNMFPDKFPRLNNALREQDPQGAKTFSYRTYGFLRLLSHSTELADLNPSHPMNVIVRALNEPTKYPDYAFLVRVIIAANDYVLNPSSDGYIRLTEAFLLEAHNDLIRHPISDEQISLLYQLGMSSRLVIFPRQYDREVSDVNLLILTVLFLVGAASFTDSLQRLPSIAKQLSGVGPFSNLFKALFG